MTDTPFELPFKSPNIPSVLTADSKIRFRCHKGVSCFNACCKQADVTLAPYDILRLKDRLGVTSTEFVREYAVPFQMDADGLPGLKLKTDDTGACLQLNGDQGCGVYENRPTVCRYYPVALLALREKDACETEEHYSLVKETHCKGHEEDRELRVGVYRAEQGCEDYDERNREWYELLLKKKSAGPTVGKPPQASFQLFFMASYDIDSFRRFVMSENFRGTYALPDHFYQELERSDESLLAFGYQFLRQVLFGERTVKEVANVWEQRVEQRKALWEARKELEIERRLADEDKKYHDSGDAYCGDN